MKDTVKLFFAVDVHGGERTWRKWLSVPEYYKADILVLAGDLTGKVIAPIIKREDKFTCKLFGKRMVAHTKAEVEQLAEKANFSGYYPYVTDREEVSELRNDPKKLEALFERLMRERIRKWLRMVEEKVAKDIKVIVMPGNDDVFAIDDIIKGCERVIYPLGKTVPLCFEYEMVSLDYTNPTPWDTPRECSEGELWKKLKRITDYVDVDWDEVICNFHCPPYNTHLDLAPKLDKDLKVVSSAVSAAIKEHVGSQSILRFIKRYQPLLGLHGHIHESSGFDRIGKTQVFNPGSEYAEGILKGFIFEFTKEGIKNWWGVSG